MSDHVITIGGTPAIVSFADIYRYHGLTFEFHRYLGPLRLKKNGDPSNVPPGPKFYAIIDRWQKLTPSKKKRTKIYG